MKIYLFILSYFLLSCKSKEIDINGKYEGDKLVINCILSAGDPISLKMQKTYSPFGTSIFDKNLVNPKVILYKNNQLVGNLKEDSLGYFSINYLPKEGESYFFVCSAESLPIAKTREVIIPNRPKSIRPTLSKILKSSQNPSYDAQSVSLTLDFLENKNYLISFWGKTNGNLLKLNSYSIFNSEFENPCERSFFNQTLITDKCTKENKYKFVKEVELQTFDSNFKQYKFTNFIVRIICVDDSYAQYILSYQDGFDEAIDAFGARYNRFTNIENGYGIVVATNKVDLNP